MREQSLRELEEKEHIRKSEKEELLKKLVWVVVFTSITCLSAWRLTGVRLNGMKPLGGLEGKGIEDHRCRNQDSKSTQSQISVYKVQCGGI